MAYNFFEQVGQEAMDPLVSLWNSIVYLIPGVLGAIVILVLGYIVGMLAGSGVKRLLGLTGVDKWMAKNGYKEAIGGLKFSDVAGKFTKWWIFILFLVPASHVIRLEALSSMLEAFAVWFPNLILAALIVLIGLVVADLLSRTVSQAKKLKGIKGVSSLVYVVTLVVFLDVALRQIGVDVSFPEQVILLMLAGVVIALSIGFGLGLKPHAEDMIKKWRRKYRV